MSIAARAIPLTRPVAPRRHLRPVASNPMPTRKVVTKSAVNASPNVALLMKRAVVGLVLVIIANLAMSALCNQSIYEISVLKKQAEDVSHQTQVVQEQVDSLRSPQNLANSARNLGMIVNSNPVFLKVSTGKVLGSVQTASYSSSIEVSRNRIPNSALVFKSNPKKGTDTKLDIPTTTSVKNAKTTSVQVVLPSAGIPASPTH